ncbi:Integrase [Oceanobacillus picturae]|uniref:Integrase n=1 Tax=Oceanobacillus picturae TaxID=171693 RepID=W9ACC8_9BACI|nr:site-specific integrase [Oceanobacillus picturae]CDO03138.1 Integrase [Oceanobacillus picturae]
MPVYKDEQRGTYYFIAWYKNIYGKSKQKMVRGFRRERDAKDAEAEFRVRVKKHGAPEDMTFEEVFYHNIEHTELKPKTKRRRINEYNKHMKDKLGNIKIHAITTQQCLEFKQYLLDNLKSNETARTVFSGFKVVINHAIKYFELPKDPAKAVPAIKRVKKKHSYIRRQEFDKRVQTMDNEVFKNMCIFMFYTGLRIGEAIALQWQDIDFELKEADINKTYDYDSKELGPPKTEASADVVPLADFLVGMLEEIKSKQQTEMYGFKESYYIFGGMVPTSYKAFHVAFKKVFSEYRPHDLRHSYASFLANRKVDIFVLKSLMRHDNVQETINTYGHLYKEKKHEAISFLND